MKVNPKILTLNFIIVIIFWSLAQPGYSWSAAGLPPETNSQVSNQNPSNDKAARAKNDSLAALLCDRQSPYFANLDPDTSQKQVDFDSIIKFTVIDSFLQKKRNEWDRFGVDTNKIFIDIQTRFWNVDISDSVKPHNITLVDSIFEVDCEYYPSQPFDWTDTIKVHLFATDVSYLKNHAETTYVFYTVRDTIPPELIPVYPQHGATPVPIDTGIVIQGTEIGRGTVLDDIKLWIRGFPVIPDSVVGDPWSFKIYSIQDSIWNYGDTVHVSCTAHDLDGNADTLDYWFVIESAPDETPPLIEVIWPKPDSTNIQIDTDIVLYVKDDDSGVDRASIEFKVDNQVITLNDSNFINDSVGDTVHYHPSTPFNYLSEVQVYFYVADLAGNPADTSYSFWTELEPDTNAPWFVDLDPDSADTNVSPDSKVKFTVVDDKSGVDTNSVTVKLERKGGEYTEQGNPQIIQILDDGKKLICEYQPREQFDYGDSVTVTLTAQDTVHNEGFKEYWFAVADTDSTIIVYDQEGPIVFDHDPEIFGNIDTLEYFIQFKVRDTSGVDVLSILTKININNGPDQFLSLKKIVSPNSDTVRVESQLLQFNYNDTVVVDIYAEDAVGNKTVTDSTTHYYFTVQQDLAAPRVVLIEPTQLSGVKDSFLVRIEDELSGVDLEKCEMYLWSRKRTDQTKIDIPSFVKSNRVNTVDIEYYPDRPYEYNDVLSLKFFLQDKVGNSATVTLLDTIYTPRQMVDLFVLNLTSSAATGEVPPNTTVSFDAYIVCKNADCPDSFAVGFYFDEQEVPFHTVWLEGLSKDDLKPLKTSHVIFEGRHKVTVIVDFIPEGGRILEEDETNNTAEVTISGGRPILNVRNIFTPNDDGFNDNAVFNFEQFDVENPNLKIFDMHGKKVKEFDIAHNKRFEWRGLDSSGRPLLPGVYLYIFSDKNKALARGAIVIAR